MARLAALLPLSFLAVAASCRCGAELETLGESVRIEPASIDFPNTYVGATRMQSPRIENLSRAPVHLTLEGTDAFSLSATELDVVPMPEAIRTISSGQEHTCAQGASGSVFCWGRNDTGQLGVRSLQESTFPMQAVP